MLATVSRAIQVMAVLGQHPRGLTLSELAAEAGSNKQAVFRIAKTLAAFQLVATDPLTGRLCLGPGLLHLSSAIRPELDLREIALPELTRLRDTTGETACLHVMFGNARMCIVQVESKDEIRWTAEVGRPFPLTGAPGKVFIAFLPDGDRARLLRAAKPAQGRSSMGSEWEREISKVRRSGYALARNETIEGVSSVSAPVFDGSGNIIAAVTLLGRSKALSSERLRQYADLLRDAAERISRVSGAYQANQAPPRTLTQLP